MEPVEASEHLYAELLARSSLVADLDSPQLEGFASGLFAAWDDDAQALGFVGYCRERPGPVPAALLAALAMLSDDTLAERAQAAFDSMAEHAPETIAELGRSRAAQAWQVTAGFGNSLVIGFGPDDDAIDHAVLAELDADSVMTDLNLSGAPDDLLDPAVLGTDDLQVTPIEASEGLRLLADAWNQAAEQGTEATPGMIANQRLVRHRVQTELGMELPLFTAGDDDIDWSRGMTSTEIEQANSAALSTLQAALGPVLAGEAHVAWVQAVSGRVPGLSPREREGLLWLEWADWLGAGIGLVRAGRDVIVDGAALVAFVNGCPEVSSTIHADDRDYAEWAFDLALDHLRDADLIIEHVLTDAGALSLHASLIAAWTPATEEAADQ